LVAIKIFDKSSPHNNAKALETLKKEVEIYQTLNHPYMVRLLEFKEDSVWKKSDGKQIRVAYMVLEYISGGELFDFVALRSFDERTSRHFFKQML